MTEAPDAGLFFFWGWHLALLLGRRYNRAKKAQGAPAGNSNAAKQTDQIDPVVSTAEKLATEHGVSPAACQVFCA